MRSFAETHTPNGIAAYYEIYPSSVRKEQRKAHKLEERKLTISSITHRRFWAWKKK
jgi:hypothetical protein